MRKPFTDGLNSASHFAQGYLFGETFFPFFLAYQIAQGKPNDFIDVVEYLAGWIVNGVLLSRQLRSDADSARVSDGGSGLTNALYSWGSSWPSDQTSRAAEMDSYLGYCGSFIWSARIL